MMNTPFFTPITPLYFTKNSSEGDKEKEQILNKVYNSDVFKEFINQWGNSMPPMDSEIKKNIQK